ncbi:hypothetical protein RFI_10472, partial [Reticulomyxa filosa]
TFGKGKVPKGSSLINIIYGNYSSAIMAEGNKLSESDQSKQSKIPLTIITGYLGSGKTTLVNRLLDELVSKKKKVAIIQNEYSSGGVEETTATSSDGNVYTNLVELANGCVCCTVRGNFSIVVEDLAKEHKYDYILLECSGLADPAPLIGMFWIDNDLEADIYLDGVISVCDSKYLLTHTKWDAHVHNDHKDKEEERDDGNKYGQIIHQVAFADRILLNKQDLITSEEHIASLMNKITSINQIARVYLTQKSVIPNLLGELLYIRAYNNDNSEYENALVNMKEATTKHSSNCAQCATQKQCCHDPHVQNFVLEKRGSCVTISKVEEWLSDVLWQNAYDENARELIAYKKGLSTQNQTEKATEKEEDNNNDDDDDDNGDKISSKTKMDIYRMKAVLPVATGENYYLQAVGELFDIEKGKSKWKQETSSFSTTNQDSSNANDENCLCRFVVIGKRLDKDILQQGFETIF